MTVDPIILTGIMGFLGVGVIGIIQILKEFLKAEGIGAWAIAVIVSIGATAITLLQAGLLKPLPVIIYSVVVFFEATGIYRVVTKEIGA